MFQEFEINKSLRNEKENRTILLHFFELHKKSATYIK